MTIIKCSHFEATVSGPTLHWNLPHHVSNLLLAKSLPHTTHHFLTGTCHFCRSTLSGFSGAGLRLFCCCCLHPCSVGPRSSVSRATSGANHHLFVTPDGPFTGTLTCSLLQAPCTVPSRTDILGPNVVFSLFFLQRSSQETWECLGSSPKTSQEYQGDVYPLTSFSEPAALPAPWQPLPPQLDSSPLL